MHTMIFSRTMPTPLVDMGIASTSSETAQGGKMVVTSERFHKERMWAAVQEPLVITRSM